MTTTKAIRKTSANISSTLIASIVILSFIATTTTTSHQSLVEAKKLKFCRLDNMLECLVETFAMFTSQPNGTGIVNTEQEFEQFCFNYHDFFPHCVRRYLSRCGSPMHTELLNRVVLEPIRESLRVFCDSKGDLRKRFLEHSKCLIELVKLSPEYRSKCVRVFQANNEHIHEEAVKRGDFMFLLKNFCCAYNKWQGCIVGELNTRCSTGAGDIFPYLIHHSSFELLQNLCPIKRYDPTNASQCVPEEFLAPTVLKPKGIKSNSLVSYMFSYMCPNVGWGIEDHHDY